jgi:MFS family permease
MGLGLVVGSYLGASRLEERGAGRVYGTAIALMAVGIGGAAAAPNVWVAAVLLVLTGVGNGAALVCNAVLIQRGVPDRLRGRAFTVAMSVSYAALGVGMISGGPLTDALGPRPVWGLAAGVLALAAPVAFALSRAGMGEVVSGDPGAISTGTRS